MGKAQSKLSRFPSKYSPKKWVTDVQYIIELVCEQQARFQQTDLPAQFWHSKEWATYYKSQLRACHKLLKKYSSKAIIQIVKTKRIRNLLPKWIEPLIAQEDTKVKSIQIPKQKSESQSIITTKAERRVEPLSSSMNKLLLVDERLNGEKKEE